MTLSKDVIRIRIASIQTAISKLPDSERTKNISYPMAENFNEILNGVRGLVPDGLEAALPKRLEKNSVFSEIADATHFDLDAFCEQVLGLLDYAGDPK